MKKLLLLLSTLCLFLLTVAQVAAQSMPAPPPPPILLITREEIKPGKMPAHTEEALANVRVMAKANSMIADRNLRNYRLAMSPIAGNQNEVTYFFAYGSFADMENKNKEVDKLSSGMMKADYEALPDHELHAAQTDIISAFRPDLSYGIGNVDIAQARYMVMTMLRLKPGHEDEYWEASKKFVNPARDKTPLKTLASYAVYQVRGGMPGPTYLTLRVLKTLADLDTASMTLVRPMMSKSDREEMDKIADRAVVLTTTNYYAFNPRLSLVAPEFMARDTSSPGFWIANPAPAMPSNASSGKAGTRPQKKQ
ncbi:MAG: hypothetical protein LC754_11125 [Acidobacteria bacterium]|nr:hypothetical protein [Acidobacteriota bacterium]